MEFLQITARIIAERAATGSTVGFTLADLTILEATYGASVVADMFDEEI